MMNIEYQDVVVVAEQILELFPNHYTQPASISGKHHNGETQRQHLEKAVKVMEHLCREFNIIGHQKDVLIAATWLHDIGQYIITAHSEISLPEWDYYKKTGYCRCKSLFDIHGLIGALLLDKFRERFIEEDYKKIRRMVACHMSHWNPDSPQPETFEEKLVCIADYIAAQGDKIFE